MWRRSLRRHRPTGAEAHREPVVLLGLEGSAQYLVDGQVYALRRGSVLWAMAGQQHVLLSETAGYEMRVVLVADAALPEHCSGLPPFARPRPAAPAACGQRRHRTGTDRRCANVNRRLGRPTCRVALVVVPALGPVARGAGWSGTRGAPRRGSGSTALAR